MALKAYLKASSLWAAKLAAKDNPNVIVSSGKLSKIPSGSKVLKMYEFEINTK